MNEPARLHAPDELEVWIERSLGLAFGPFTPIGLRDAMTYAVFPGGARVRPRLVRAVARACGGSADDDVMRAAAAVELLHCASLVHDDMPCFDDAATRRGRPTVHARYGDAMALLVGDGLIVASFATMAAGRRSTEWIGDLASAAGAGRGLVAGQAWELEPAAALDTYHEAKTGALFEAACSLGARAAGGEVEAFRALGRRVGAVYQIADDLFDVSPAAASVGKPIGQDDRHDRPNAVHRMGREAALRLLTERVDAMLGAVPPCPGARDLRRVLQAGLGPVVDAVRDSVTVDRRQNGRATLAGASRRRNGWPLTRPVT